MYGEDGLDICKSQYLNKNGISFLLENSECIPPVNLRESSREDDVKSAQKAVSKILIKFSNQSVVIYFISIFTFYLNVTC